MIMVSACLMGKNCKYHGGSNRDEKLIGLLADREVTAICPEELAGLPAPRQPAEIRIGGSNAAAETWQVVSRTGEDLSSAFLKGAQKTCRIAAEKGVTLVIFKERSPSCGVERIYDGTFSSRLIPGCGLSTALLRRQGCRVVSEEDPDLAALILEADSMSQG